MSYSRVVFESALEYLAHCEEGLIPNSVYVVFDGKHVLLGGEGCNHFDLDDSITQQEFIETAFTMLSSRVHIK